MVALDDCIKIGRTRNITNRIQAYKQTNTNVEILFASPVSTFEHAEKQLKQSLINRVKGLEYFEDNKLNREVIREFKELNMPTRRIYK